MYLGNAITQFHYSFFSVQKTELLVMIRVTARQQTRRNAHLEHLAREAIEATYGDPAKVAVLRCLSNPVLPPITPKPRWRGRKLSD